MGGGTEKSEAAGSRWELAAHLVRDRKLGLAKLGGDLVYFVIAAFGWNLLPCPFLGVTGKPCPGCGMTRSCLAFLRGEFLEVWLSPVRGEALSRVFHLQKAIEKRITHIQEEMEKPRLQAYRSGSEAAFRGWFNGRRDRHPQGACPQCGAN